MVGASSAYGPSALEVGTAVKLSRVLYLIPITLIASFWVFRQRAEGPAKAKPQIPWFVGGFLLASLARTEFPPVADASATIKLFATAGLSLALFLIGAGISRSTLKEVGVRPMLQGIALWLFISVAALATVKYM